MVGYKPGPYDESAKSQINRETLIWGHLSTAIADGIQQIYMPESIPAIIAN
jgi:hypothetical protein